MADMFNILNLVFCFVWCHTRRDCEKEKGAIISKRLS